MMAGVEESQWRQPLKSPSFSWESKEDKLWQLCFGCITSASCFIPEEMAASAFNRPALPQGIRQKVTSSSDVRATTVDLLFLKYLTNIDCIYPVSPAGVKLFY